MDHPSSAHSAVLGLKILHAGPDHIPMLTPLFDAYRMYYGEASNVKAVEEFLLARMSDLQSVVYIAVGSRDDGPEEALGFIQLYPGFSSVSLQRVWNLNDVYVTEAARCSGVAHALVDKARHHAEQTDSAGLVTSIRHHNHPASSLFRSTGFVHDDEFEYYFRPMK